VFIEIWGSEGALIWGYDGVSGYISEVKIQTAMGKTLIRIIGIG